MLHQTRRAVHHHVLEVQKLLLQWSLHRLPCGFRLPDTPREIVRGFDSKMPGGHCIRHLLSRRRLIGIAYALAEIGDYLRVVAGWRSRSGDLVLANLRRVLLLIPADEKIGIGPAHRSALYVEIDKLVEFGLHR